MRSVSSIFGYAVKPDFPGYAVVQGQGFDQPLGGPACIMMCPPVQFARLHAIDYDADDVVQLEVPAMQLIRPAPVAGYEQQLELGVLEAADGTGALRRGCFAG